MQAYVLWIIGFAIVGAWLGWINQRKPERQIDYLRFMDAVLLIGKYLPWILGGASVGLGIVLLL